MPLPTQDDIDGAIDTWFDDNFSDGAIIQDTGSYNQLFSSKQALKDGIFGAIDDTSETKASNTFTTTGNLADGDQVAIGLVAAGVKTYTAKAALDNVDGHFLLGGTEAATHANLQHAINAAGGVPGTDYALATTAHPDVTATDDGAHVLTVTAKAAGEGGDAITTTTTSAAGAWATPTLTGGVGDDEPLALAAIDDWRDSLRVPPIESNDDAGVARVAQIDSSVDPLKTIIAALFT